MRQWTRSAEQEFQRHLERCARSRRCRMRPSRGDGSPARRRGESLGRSGVELVDSEDLRAALLRLGRLDLADPAKLRRKERWLGSAHRACCSSP